MRDRWEEIEFTLDTGSSASSLHPFDAARRLDFTDEELSDSARWANREVRTGIGGGAIYFIVPATYRFREMDGRIRTIESALRIARLTETNRYLPSILGWDVLRLFDIHLNWNTRTITLD